MSLSSPVREAVVHRLPRTESLRQVTPRRTGFGAVQNGLDEQSIATGDLIGPGLNVLQTIPLHATGESSWDNNTLHSVSGGLTPPLTAADVAFIRINLIQNSSSCQLFTTSDNWNIANIEVDLSSSSGGTPLTILDLQLNPQVRLEDHGNGQPWSVTFPASSSLACPVACSSGMSCATQSDCTVGTCVGGTGIAGSGCCTVTSTACGCDSDCPSGETCFNDGVGDPNGTCGDSFAGTCQ
jgi:hypothetical protein